MAPFSLNTKLRCTDWRTCSALGGAGASDGGAEMVSARNRVGMNMLSSPRLQFPAKKMKTLVFLHYCAHREPAAKHDTKNRAHRQNKATSLSSSSAQPDPSALRPSPPSIEKGSDIASSPSVPRPFGPFCRVIHDARPTTPTDRRLEQVAKLVDPGAQVEPYQCGHRPPDKRGVGRATFARGST